MFVECLIHVLGNGNKAVNKTDENKQNSLCDIGFSFLIWKMEDWTKTTPWAVSICGSLSFVSAACPKPESVLQVPGGGWAGDLEPER